jgi:hypothetical protein
MTAADLAAEYWKAYSAYLERKERLVEVTTTLYLAAVSALVIREASFWDFWLRTAGPLRVWVGGVLLVGTVVAVLIFVRAQMRLRTSGARISNAAQTLMTRWSRRAPAPFMVRPVRSKDFAWVALPAGLVVEMRVRRRMRTRRVSRWKKVCDWFKFDGVVYGLLLVWTIALLARIYVELCHTWVKPLWGE